MTQIIGIKIGSNCVNEDNLKKLAQGTKELIDSGHQIFFVVSGAVKEWITSANCKEYPDKRMERKKSAAFGQPSLVNRYSNALKGVTNVGQILVTYEELKNPKTAIALKETLEGIMEEGKIPVINYNDPLSVAVKESEIRQKLKILIKKMRLKENIGEKISRLISEYKLEEELFKDNDCLAAIMAVLLRASRLLILTDKVDGLMDGGELIHYACLDDIERYKEICIGKGGEFNTGGMFAKLVAAQIMLSELVYKDDEETELIIGNIEYNIVDLLGNKAPHTEIRKSSMTWVGNKINFNFWK